MVVSSCLPPSADKPAGKVGCWLVRLKCELAYGLVNSGGMLVYGSYEVRSGKYEVGSASFVPPKADRQAQGDGL